MQRFLCESQKQKNWVANKQFKRYEEKWKCFCAFACAHQSKSLVCSQEQEGLCMNQTDYINNLRIHQGSLLTSLLLTTGWTDARQSHVQYTDYTVLNIWISRLFVYSSGTFIAVRWRAKFGNPRSWHLSLATILNCKKGGATCEVAAWKLTWIVLQSIALWSRV